MKFKDVEVKQTKWFNLQRAVVSHMTTESWQHIPHVTYIYEPDITEFYNEFNLLMKEKGSLGYKITFNTMMLKVIVEGLLAAPELNSYIEYNHKRAKGKLHVLEEINISVPWLLADGKMITPVILNAEKMSLRDISCYISKLAKRIENTNIDELLYRTAFAHTVNELKQLNIGIIRRIISSKLGTHRTKGISAKEKEEYYKIPENERLSEKDIICGTVTVSNIGSLYKEQKGFFGLLEIIPPQVFAIGIGPIQEKPGVYVHPAGRKEIGIRKVLPLCLAFDHRAVDFSSIVPFLKRLDEIFGKPSVIRKW